MTNELDALYAQFPKLSSAEHRITSGPSDAYNCVAWVVRDTERWWEPGFFWPYGAPDPTDDEDLACYVALFRRMGFEVCDSPALEHGSLKIALYTDDGGFHHVAKQLPSGRWSSKAGLLHDLRHDELDALTGSGILKHALPTTYMRRHYDGADQMTLEETGLVEL